MQAMKKLEREMGHFTKLEVVKNLRTIVQCTTFCTVCFDINGELLHLDNSLIIEDLDEEALTLRELLETILGNTGNALFSDYICETCKSFACTVFTFINKTRRAAVIYSKYLEQLDKETSEFMSRPIDSKWKNAMIILDDHQKCEDSNVKKKATDVLYTCDLCGKGYNRRSFMVKHLKKHAMGTRINCPHCGNRPCIHEKYLTAYYQQRILKRKPMTCIECGSEFGQTLPYLIAHVNKVHLDIKTNICHECGKTFYLESQYTKHFEYHHDNKHVCTYCFRKFRSTTHLKTHMDTCESVSKPFKCSECPVLSETKLLNQFHMTTHSIGYSERPAKNSDKKIKRTRIYKCLMCDEVMKTKLELRSHMKNKHEKKPNQCLYCNQQFSSRQEYLVHVQTQEHKKNIPYAFKHNCSHCDYSANTPEMLKAHNNRVHLNIRPFECEHCQKRYFDSTQLKNHIKTHTGQRKPKVCDICGAHLAGPTALKKHRRLHTGENPYSCSYCDIKFNCNSSLKTHIMRKHMEPTIACPLCDLKFHTMNNARGHVRKTHWKSTEKFDYTKLKGLSPKDYDFFRDRRKAID